MNINNKITPVILSGGIGSRLWPLSTKDMPKQFIPLIEGKSLFDLTLLRAKLMSKRIYIATNEDYRFFIANALKDKSLSGKVILEPCSKNTASTILMASILEEARGGGTLLFLPSDHFIPDSKKFIEIIKKGIKPSNDGLIVTFGITPTSPSTDFGYIKYKDTRFKKIKKIQAFHEKPKIQLARRFLSQGNVLWNSGIFLAHSATIINAFRDFAPDILKNCNKSFFNSSEEQYLKNFSFFRPNANYFSKCRFESFDIAIMQNLKSAIAILFETKWSDLGNWNAMANLTIKDNRGNNKIGKILIDNASNSYLYSPEKLLFGVGINNLVIINTEDALLVVDKKCIDRLKHSIIKLQTSELGKKSVSRKAYRPWGWYKIIEESKRYIVKLIAINPDASISLQKHQHRSEHWIMVKGSAYITKNKKSFYLKENESTFIPKGEIHRIHNNENKEIQLVEVQSGNKLSENDIIRYKDLYSRLSKK